MVIIDTSTWLHDLESFANYLDREIGIRYDETERFLSWSIREGFARGFPEVVLLDHSFNDKYEAGYDSIFYGKENMLRVNLKPIMETYVGIRCVRILPMLDKTVLAIGV